MFKLRERLPDKTVWIIKAGSVVVAIAAWVALTSAGAVEPAVLPGPGALLESFQRLYFDHFLVANALVSLARISIGFLAAALVALPVGIAMGAFTPVRAALQPLLSPLRYLPIAAVVPAFIFWFDLGETMIVALLFTGTFVYLLPLVVETVDAVDDAYLRIASTLGATSWQKIWTILVPASLPAIFDALRVLFGIGWTYVMLAEFMSIEGEGFGYGGIGYLMNQQRRFGGGTLSDMLVCVGVILAIGIGVDLFMRWVGRMLFPWYQRARLSV